MENTVNAVEIIFYRISSFVFGLYVEKKKYIYIKCNFTFFWIQLSHIINKIHHMRAFIYHSI